MSYCLISLPKLLRAQNDSFELLKQFYISTLAQPVVSHWRKTVCLTTSHFTCLSYTDLMTATWLRICPSGRECAVCDLWHTACVSADDRSRGGDLSLCGSPRRAGGSVGSADRGAVDFYRKGATGVQLPGHLQNALLWVCHTPKYCSSRVIFTW